MEVAHLILAHKGPKQLERLINVLSLPGTAIYIHIDKKTDITPFNHLKKIKNVFFIQNRIKIYWGSYSMIQATLVSFKEISDSGIPFKYVNLLSGQDYPIKPIKEFCNYLNSNQGKIFMSYLVFETDWNEAISRINQYHFTNYKIRSRYFFQRVINWLLPARVFPTSLVPVGKSQWFTLPLECVKYVLDYWQDNKELQRFIKFTWAPDEFIFQTILYNSKYKENIVNDNLRFMIWTKGHASPDWLKTDDIDKIQSSDKFFARKFDIEVDARILDLLDKIIATDNIPNTIV